MMKAFHSRSSAALLLAAVLAPVAAMGQATAGQPVISPSAQTATQADNSSAGAQAGPSPATMPDYRLEPSDSIQINVWKQKELSGTFPVRPDGMISMVLLGDVRAAGLTPMELAAVLKDKLKKYIQDPLVTVTVMAANSQKVYVLGEVTKVGAVNMSAQMTPLQAIAAAGGLTPYAKEKDVYILRGPAGHQQKIRFNYKRALKGDPNSSVQLKAGDTIVVP